MKAVILHGTGNNHKGNWFPWLKIELEKLGYEVWVPDLPEADRPNAKKYTNFLLNQDWDFNNNLVIGHSAGAVEVLHLLENLPKSISINTAIMVAVFKGDLGWENLKSINKPAPNLQKIKQKAKQFIVVQSDDDPYCPTEDARDIAVQLGAEFKLFHGMKHFSKNTEPRFVKFPELLQIIKAEVKV